MSNRRNRTQWGVSLVECCAALAVSSVLATASVASFKDLGERRRLEGRVAELSTDLHHLRTEAVSQHRALRIRFQADAGGSCYVIHHGSQGDCGCDSSGTASCEGDTLAVKVVSLPASERLSLSSNVGSILIDPRLGTATPGGTIRLSDSHGREVRHIVNIMGRLRTCSPNGKVAGHPAC